jgi:hypothetical protein
VALSWKWPTCGPKFADGTVLDRSGDTSHGNRYQQVGIAQFPCMLRRYTSWIVTDAKPSSGVARVFWMTVEWYQNTRGTGTTIRAPCVSSANRCGFPKERGTSADKEEAGAIAPSKPSATPARAQSLCRIGKRSAGLLAAVGFEERATCFLLPPAGAPRWAALPVPGRSGVKVLLCCIGKAGEICRVEKPALLTAVKL